MKSSRHKARELALRALYQQRLSGSNPNELMEMIKTDPEGKKADAGYFESLIRSIEKNEAELERMLESCLDREMSVVSPIERAILLIGAEELLNNAQIPYRVVLNEAIELAKRYGGTDGHRFVNGVLDKLALSTRSVEVAHWKKVQAERQ
ncbi:MAG TPA: transcription antitermination factor NusB [Burkholderiales bacterium]|nr:transcription antitermination factor NusB [Pseudomonadota bacterium]HVC49960.1 transcription antitermination factor NusB [Burkholderiales bacterium]